MPGSGRFALLAECSDKFSKTNDREATMGDGYRMNPGEGMRGLGKRSRRGWGSELRTMVKVWVVIAGFHDVVH